MGARAMQFEVQTSDGGPISPRRALVRCVGLFLAALPLFLGFVPILYDNRRRGFQDRFAGTVVVNAPAVSMIEARRARKREQYLAASADAPGVTLGGAAWSSSPDLLESLRHDDPGSRFEQGEM
jgi:RDD family